MRRYVLQLESDYFICKHASLEDAKFAAHDWMQLNRLDGLRSRLVRWATADRSETGQVYVDKYQCPTKRGAEVVAATMDGMGVVAPPETYRPLSLPDKKLRAFLRKHDDPCQIVEEARASVATVFRQRP